MSWLSYSPLIPPNLFILLTAMGLVLAWRWRRFGLIVATVGGACLYLASTSIVAEYLYRFATGLVDAIPGLPSDTTPGAIIVLASDFRRGQQYTVGPMTLERLVEAARQERRLALPVLGSGGPPNNKTNESLAGMMSAVLQNDFGVPVRWQEDRSRNTFENAAFSAEILRRAGVPTALLVTQSWDMARALWSFRAVGYPVIPAAPRQRAAGQPRNELPALSPSSFFPTVPALLVSYNALHELIGFGWYLCRYGNW